MYQVNVYYNNKIEEITYNCKTIEEASKERYKKISKWFKKYEALGKKYDEICELLHIEIKEQEG